MGAGRLEGARKTKSPNPNSVGLIGGHFYLSCDCFSFCIYGYGSSNSNSNSFNNNNLESSNPWPSTKILSFHFQPSKPK